MPANEIAQFLGGEITAAEATTLAEVLVVPGVQSGMRCVSVPISRNLLHPLGRRAADEGVDPTEWSRQVAIAAIRDDLYDMITDGKFDAAN